MLFTLKGLARPVADVGTILGWCDLSTEFALASPCVVSGRALGEGVLRLVAIGVAGRPSPRRCVCSP